MKIGIVGLGFVGLSLSSVLASKGYEVIGIDNDTKKSEKISKGKLPFFEPDLEKTLINGLRKKLTISNTIFANFEISYFLFKTRSFVVKREFYLIGTLTKHPSFNINK